MTLSDVLRFTTQVPLRERAQKCVKPSSSKVPGGFCSSVFPRAEPPQGRSNGTSRVLSGWIVNPYFSNRLGSTAITLQKERKDRQLGAMSHPIGRRSGARLLGVDTWNNSLGPEGYSKSGCLKLLMAVVRSAGSLSSRVESCCRKSLMAVDQNLRTLPVLSLRDLDPQVVDDLLTRTDLFDWKPFNRSARSNRLGRLNGE
jgi:hypothetical protein